MSNGSPFQDVESSEQENNMVDVSHSKEYLLLGSMLCSVICLPFAIVAISLFPEGGIAVCLWGGVAAGFSMQSQRRKRALTLFLVHILLLGICYTRFIAN